MQLDPKKSLLLAFKHLDQFSIPALGTFRRSRIAAKIDRQSKKILPPKEVFVLESGEGQSAALQDFFFRFYNLKINQANELMEKVSAFVATELETKGLIYLEGIGKLKGNSEENVAFEAEDSVFGQTSDFFGLQAVDYTVGAADKPNLEKKQAVARQSALANQVVVEPAPPPVKRRKFPVGLFAFLFLLLIASGAAFIWQDQLTEAIKGFGNGGGGETEIASNGGTPHVETDHTLVDSADGNKSETSEDENVDAGSKIDGEFSEKSAKELAETLKKGLAEEKAKKLADEKAKKLADAKAKKLADEKAKKLADAKAQKLADEKAKKLADAKAKKLADAKAKKLADEKTKSKASSSDNTKYGQSAQRGRYYLVVSSTPNGADAEAAAKAISASGSTPKALKSYGKYKVSAYDNTDKAKVIAKMVAWKKKYSKSWIYWVGM